MTQPEYLGPTHKQLVRSLMDGWTLAAHRTYPGPWRWVATHAGGLGVHDISEAAVTVLVAAGCGVVVSLRASSRGERRVFDLDRAGAEAALERVRPRGPDPDQLNWIPDDHPAMKRVRKDGSAA